MTLKNHQIGFLFGGFLFLLDQGFKYFFLTHQNFSFFLFHPYFGVEYFQNPGIAFGIPVPQIFILLLTPLLLLFLLLQLFKEDQKKKSQIFFLSFLFFGALSNFSDRIFFEFTIDYLRIFTSIFNIADILIVFSILGLLFNEHISKD